MVYGWRGFAEVDGLDADGWTGGNTRRTKMDMETWARSRGLVRFGKRGLLRKLVDDLQCWMGRIKGRICHRNMFYGAEGASGRRLELEVLCMRIIPSGYVMSSNLGSDATSVRRHVPPKRQTARMSPRTPAYMHTPQTINYEAGILLVYWDAIIEIFLPEEPRGY